MRTNREFVSRISNDLKALTKDGRITRRHILAIGQDKAKFLLAQKLDELTLFREEDLSQHINCFELENLSSIECDIIEFRNCRSVMKSVKELPEGLFGKKGSGIISVTSIDGSIVFHPTNERAFRNIQRLKHTRDLSSYYLIKNKHLYLPNSEVEVVNIHMIATKRYQEKDASACCDKVLDCKSFWDYEFVCPDRFFDLVVRDTLTELANIYRTSVEDSNPNLDVNQKGKTTE